MNYKRLRTQRRKNFNLYCSDALPCDLSFEHNLNVDFGLVMNSFSSDAVLLIQTLGVFDAAKKPFEGHKIRFYRANTAFYVHFQI